MAVTLDTAVLTNNDKIVIYEKSVSGHQRFVEPQK